MTNATNASSCLPKSGKRRLLNESYSFGTPLIEVLQSRHQLSAPPLHTAIGRMLKKKKFRNQVSNRALKAHR